MNEKQARALVYARSEFNGVRVCEVCFCNRATNFQHRKNRSQGGLWTPANGVDVCGSGTTGCHGWIHSNVEKAVSFGWALRSWQDPLTTPVKLLQIGWVLLDDQGGWTATEPLPGQIDTAA